MVSFKQFIWVKCHIIVKICFSQSVCRLMSLRLFRALFVSLSLSLSPLATPSGNIVQRKSTPDHVGCIFKTSTRDFCLIFDGVTYLSVCMFTCSFLLYIHICLNLFYFSILFDNRGKELIKQFRRLFIIIIWF